MWFWLWLPNHLVGTALTSKRLIWSAHSNSESPRSNTVSRLPSRSPRPIEKSTDSAYRPTAISQSPGWRHKGDQPADCHPAADAGKTDVPSANQPAATGVSPGMHQAHPALELRPSSWPPIPRRLLHTLLAYSSEYSSSNSRKYLL
jgi:hypothetical protein